MQRKEQGTCFSFKRSSNPAISSGRAAKYRASPPQQRQRAGPAPRTSHPALPARTGASPQNKVPKHTSYLSPKIISLCQFTRVKTWHFFRVCIFYFRGAFSLQYYKQNFALFVKLNLIWFIQQKVIPENIHQAYRCI